MRAILRLCGGLLIVVGLTCSFGGLAILTFGPPARWLDDRSAIEPRMAVNASHRGVLRAAPVDPPAFPHDPPASYEPSRSSTDEMPTSDRDVADELTY
jgi:hypothetical protein